MATLFPIGSELKLVPDDRLNILKLRAQGITRRDLPGGASVEEAGELKSFENVAKRVADDLIGPLLGDLEIAADKLISTGGGKKIGDVSPTVSKRIKFEGFENAGWVNRHAKGLRDLGRLITMMAFLFASVRNIKQSFGTVDVDTTTLGSFAFRLTPDVTDANTLSANEVTAAGLNNLGYVAWLALFEAAREGYRMWTRDAAKAVELSHLASLFLFSSTLIGVGGSIVSLAKLTVEVISDSAVGWATAGITAGVSALTRQERVAQTLKGRPSEVINIGTALATSALATATLLMIHSGDDKQGGILVRVSPDQKGVTEWFRERIMDGMFFPEFLSDILLVDLWGQTQTGEEKYTRLAGDKSNRLHLNLADSHYAAARFGTQLLPIAYALYIFVQSLEMSYRPQQLRDRLLPRTTPAFEGGGEVILKRGRDPSAPVELEEQEWGEEEEEVTDNRSPFEHWSSGFFSMAKAVVDANTAILWSLSHDDPSGGDSFVALREPLAKTKDGQNMIDTGTQLVDGIGRLRDTLHDGSESAQLVAQDLLAVYILLGEYKDMVETLHLSVLKTNSGEVMKATYGWSTGTYDALPSDWDKLYASIMGRSKLTENLGASPLWMYTYNDYKTGVLLPPSGMHDNARHLEYDIHEHSHPGILKYTYTFNTGWLVEEGQKAIVDLGSIRWTR